MAKRPVIFRQADLTRALRGAKAAGLAPSKVTIDAGGSIVVDFQSGAPAAAAETPFDEWRRKRDASAP